ncbi:chaperone SurA precursor [Variibacter gotjawalensis]|uniref:Chaperone SurA n=1 Tax=Variibacter gotjawalensis TaxID=1333996 RepID=A0A0S3PYH7_9BRAD|nr:SurA N-terminal domain-containing protein [Variibacter gotjawalensis]NIK46799.1 peptidyl-prolyl cis-trans isomerase SurA [Variibacter gotjawalensis]RZS48703.1 periplasmic chaperone for outer membrane proteins SurA [Variibacter gotjawalensis]BAT60962.1 chaperone SurA precursor [Variibacter gotjawalensis]
MTNTLRNRFLGLAALAICTTIVAAPASAQQVVARVNGDPITAVDLAQRLRLLQVSGGGKAATRQAALDELIEQELKLQTARRYKIEVSEAEINQQLASIASRVGGDIAAFGRQLQGAGLSLSSFKRKIQADIAWNGIVRGKFQSRLQVRERDVTDAIRAKGQNDGTAYTFTLRPVLLVVPNGSNPAVYESRKREAEGLRARFQSCDEGLQLARGLRDVVVREQLTRSSADVGAKQREILESTAVGKLTPPDITSSGIELFAVCNKVAGKGSVAETDMRQQMMGERISDEGKKYLRELRRQSSIQIL